MATRYSPELVDAMAQILEAAGWDGFAREMRTRPEYQDRIARKIPFLLRESGHTAFVAQAESLLRRAGVISGGFATVRR